MRKLNGTIISHNMEKTAVVRVDRLKKHAKYLKFYRISKKFKAHDEKDEYAVGDTVVIQETKPLSREKKWKITELVKRPAAESESENPSGGADDEEKK